MGTLLLAGFLPARATGPMMQGRAESWVEQAHVIGTAFLSYAVDNGNYPDGKSSTEVFQKLVDGRYVSDLSSFYVSLIPNKAKATSAKLTPENVCFDVTGGATMNSPDALPLIYLTGYKVDYKPGGSAVSLIKPSPTPGIAVTYKNGNSKFLKPADPAEGTIANFMPADVPDGGYRQLMP